MANLGIEIQNYSIWPNLLSRFEDCFGFVSLSNHQVLYLEGHLEYHSEQHPLLIS